MKLSAFEKVIRKVVREEIDYALRREIALLKEELVKPNPALQITESKPAPGHDKVTYAGLPEHEEEKERMEKGIPYHPEVIEWFKSISAELQLPSRL